MFLGLWRRIIAWQKGTSKESSSPHDNQQTKRERGIEREKKRERD
jgi:hypothetical protein